MSQYVSQVTRIDVVYDAKGVVKLKCWYEDEKVRTLAYCQQ